MATIHYLVMPTDFTPNKLRVKRFIQYINLNTYYYYLNTFTSVVGNTIVQF